jgi:hypothetical protein
MMSVFFGNDVGPGTGQRIDNSPETFTGTGPAVTTTRSPGVAIDREVAKDEYSEPAPAERGAAQRVDPDDAFDDEEHTEIPTSDDDLLDADEASEQLDQPPRRPRTADLRLWIDRDDVRHVMVRPPSLSALESATSRSRVVKRWYLMRQYGSALQTYGGLTHEAFTTNSFEGLYDALIPKSRKLFAKTADVDGSQVSRDVQWIVVEFPVGRVSLDFLFLHTPPSRSAQGRTAHEIAREIMRRPGLMWRDPAEIQKAIPGALDSVRQVVPWCRAAETWKEEVVSEAIQYRSNPHDAGGVVDRLAATLGIRHSELNDQQRQRFGDLTPVVGRHNAALSRALVMALDEIS